MTAGIEIAPLGEHSYAVTLRDVDESTRHRVFVPSSLLTELGLAPDEETTLVRTSFEFLLEREPPGSILARFDLDIIGRYFSDYLPSMRERLGRHAD